MSEPNAPKGNPGFSSGPGKIGAPDLAKNRFFLTDKPNPFAQKTRARHFKTFFVSIFVFLFVVCLAFAIVHHWGEESWRPRSVDES